MNDIETKGEPQIYQLDKLMEETRSLAAKYRAATGQTLPVSHDLACYDAIRLLGLHQPDEAESAIDAVMTVDSADHKFTIKGRVQFSNTKGRQQRIGQLNLEAGWHSCLLVLLNDEYEPTTILKATKETLSNVLSEKPANKRGAMTVAQFHKLADIVWQTEVTD